MYADRFAGKAAVVTGAGSGIGQSVALRLAAEGAQVLALDINTDGLAKTVDRVERADGALVVRECDVTKLSECRDAIEDALARFGHLDILGNIAGIARAEHVEEVTEAAYRRSTSTATSSWHKPPCRTSCMTAESSSMSPPTPG
jgi:meso-butanediol dehydrogenase / (S,S)-butanediol dehydrogenase / diacetyl reductase